MKAAMTQDSAASRRAFLKGGALAAAPLAAAAPALAMAANSQTARLSRLEDEAAIRDLHQAWLRRINTGAAQDAGELFADRKAVRFDEAVRGIAADHAGAPDSIELAADAQSAAGRYACAVEIETDIAEDCTLVQMAHAQGGGVVRHTERRVLRASYVKTGGVWAIATLALKPT